MVLCLFVWFSNTFCFNVCDIVILLVAAWFGSLFSEKKTISWALSYFHVTHPMNPLHNLFKQTPTMLTSLSKDLSCSVTASAVNEASLLTVSILINLFTVTSLNSAMRAATESDLVSTWFHSLIPGAATRMSAAHSQPEKPCSGPTCVTPCHGGTDLHEDHSSERWCTERVWSQTWTTVTPHQLASDHMSVNHSWLSHSL